MTPRRFGLIAAMTFLVAMLFAPACVAQDHKIGHGPADPWTPMTAPAVYAEYWKANVECFDTVYGRGGSGYGTVRPTPFTTMENLTFFTAGDSSFIDRRGMPVYGEFFPPDTIVLATALADHVKLVRHEMLHALGIMYHPVVPFVECGLWNVNPLERSIPWPAAAR